MARAIAATRLTTTFSEVQLTVVSGDDPDAVQAYETVEGQVEILAVNDQALCLDVDLEFLRGGEMVTAARGIITAEVVRAPNSFYFT